MVSTPTSKKVFIVHGKDEKNKNALKEMIRGWGLEPAVLAEQPNRGRVLFEKLLDHTSDVGFALVLMTADDLGASKWDVNDELYSVLEEALRVAKPDTTDISVVNGLIDKIMHGLKCLTPRVRQNVIFEYGLCIGVLGRANVCVLLQSWKGGALEIPSDVLGFGYTSFLEDVSERKEEIKRELLAAGYALESN
jgi:predicted nucleotide-binding protein